MVEETEELGIENIKEVLVFCLGLGVKIADDMDDGKISTGEAISIAFQIPKAIKTGKKMKDAIAEFKDLDPDEVSEIMKVISDKLGLKTE